MAPRRFRLSRLSYMLRYDPTGLLEWAIGLAFVFLPGLFLILGWTDLPPVTVLLLGWIRLDDHIMGLIGIVLALLQLWAGGTEWYNMRAIIATNIAGLLGIVLLSYLLGGFLYRPTVPLMLGIVIVECFIAWRCYHEKPGLSPLVQLRSGVQHAQP